MDTKDLIALFDRLDAFTGDDSKMLVMEAFQALMKGDNPPLEEFIVRVVSKCESQLKGPASQMDWEEFAVQMMDR